MASRFSISAIFRGFDRMTKPARDMSKGVARFAKQAENAVGGLNKQLATVDQKFRSLGKGMLVAGAVGGTAMIAAGKAGAEFQHTLASLNAVAKPTTDELSQISKTARQVGTDFGFSGNEVAKSMEAMSKQGLSVQEVIAGIGGVAAAAAADGSSIEDTMGGLLATMAGMGKGAKDLQHIADVMAKAGDATAASIGSLSASMSVFGPTARSLGIDIESAIAQLAILQDAGIDASSAGTTLSAVYSKLASPTAETARTLKQLGLSVKDSFGNLKPPQQLMTEVFKATSKIKGNVGQMAAFTDLVGLNSQKALLNIAAAVGSGKLDKVMSDLTSNVDGYATEIARLKQDSFIGDLNKIKAAAESLQIELFELTSGPLRDMAKRVNEWAQANQGLIISGVEKFLKDFSAALPTIVTWLERIGKMLTVFYAFRLATLAVLGALKLFVLLTTGINPFAWIAIGAALLWAFWPEISAFFGWLGRSISEFARKVGAWFSGVWDSVLSFGRGVIAAVVGFFSGLWSAIKGPLLAVGEFLLGVVVLFAQPFIWAFKGIAKAAGWGAKKIVELWRPVGEFLGRLWDNIVSAATAAVDAIAGVVSQIGGWIASAWNSVAEVAGSVWTSISEAATKAYNAITTAFEPIRGFFSDLWNGVASAFRSALGWVLEKVTWMIDNAGKFANLIRGVGRDAADGDVVVGDGPSTVNPNAATVRELRENKTSAEVTIKSDKPAAITKKPNAPGLGLRLSASGAV